MEHRMLCIEWLRAQAYFDHELDSVSAANIERHKMHCTECSALLDDLGQVRTALPQIVPYASTPPPLRARVMCALNGEAAAERPRRHGERIGNWLSRPFSRGALSGIGGTAIAAGIAFFLLAPGLTNPLLDDLLSAHVRSLMPDHLIDVISTDRHTVKPWFSSHADVSPVVADFDGQGYRLIGGRTDYFEHQRAAVVVYQSGSHVINVFSWEADRRGLPKDSTRNGYHLAFWRARNLAYCAVSDAAWDELLGLVRLLQNFSSHDGR
jgi:anti-sigma factor RsiW